MFVIRYRYAINVFPIGLSTLGEPQMLLSIEVCRAFGRHIGVDCYFMKSVEARFDAYRSNLHSA